MATLHELLVFGKEVSYQTREMGHHLMWKHRRPHSTNPIETPDLTQEQTLEQLIVLKHVPLGIYHNAGSADFEPLEKRFRTAVKDPQITAAELDVLYYPGRFYGGHGHGFFAMQAVRDCSILTEHRLEELLRKSEGSLSTLHFDLKLSQPHAVDEFMKLLKAVPEETNILISGTNWNALQRIFQNFQSHPLTVLFTINHENPHNTRINFKKMTKNLSVSEKHMIGTSIKAELATSQFMTYLQQNGLYSLLYPVDTFEGLLEAARKGADGITSNNPTILRTIEQAK